MKTFDWIWFRFNDILFYLDTEDPPIVQWLVDDFKKQCNYNRIYLDEEIWFIILQKFDKWFDDYMEMEQLEINKKK